MNNSLEYDITLSEDDKNWAYLSFKTPIGEVDNIGFPITSDIIVDGMECLSRIPKPPHIQQQRRT